MSAIRILYFVLGWVFFALGAVGVILPVLPTTPFMILALWAFAKSSQRFHNWLYNHPLFGPPLQKWQQHRVIPLPAKVLSISMMSLSFTYLVFYRNLQLYWLVLTAALMLYAAWFILTKPSYVKDKK